MLQKWWSMSVWRYSIAAEVCWEERVIVSCKVQSVGVRFWMPLLELISSLQRGDEIKGLKTNIVYWWPTEGEAECYSIIKWTVLQAAEVLV